MIGRVDDERINDRLAADVGRRRERVPRSLAAAASLVVLLVSLPVAYLVVRASGGSASSWDLILRARTLWLAARTLGLMLAVTVAAGGIGVAFAWLAVRSDLPLRRMWATLYALPLVFPSYVGAFTLLAALGPRGILQGWLEPLGVERLPDIGGFPGAWLTLTLFTFPYIYLVALASLRELDRSFEEAARTLGHARWDVFRRVTLPLLRPSLLAGGLLVALYTLHDFGAVSLMRFPTFTQAIFLQYRAAFDRTPAAILSLLLASLAVLVVAAQQAARGRRRYHRTGAGVPQAPRTVALRRWRWPAFALSAVVIGLAVVLPCAVLLHLLVRGVSEGIPLNITVGAAGGSVLAAAAGAAATVVAAAPIAVLAARYPRRGSSFAEQMAYTGYALPGLVVALALIFTAANYAPAFYQSLPLVVVAYVILFLPQAAEPLKGGLLRSNRRVEEAARTLGSSPADVVRRVIAPILARSSAVAAALVFLTAMKELPATLLLRPTGFETLATRLWTSASAGLYSRAAVPALLIVLLSAAPLAILARRIDPRGTGPTP